jgi:tetratricopeptide (TPR) repeat protein
MKNRNYRNIAVLGMFLSFLNPSAALTLEQQGLQAMKDRIPEVAAARFSDALQAQDIRPEVRQRITRHLLEALVRSGQYEEVLSMFTKASTPEWESWKYWKGLALAGLGNLRDAESEFLLHAAQATPELLEECLMSLARVQANRGDLRSAVVTLNRISQKSKNSLRARIDQCHLYLVMDQIADARNVLPSEKSLPKAASVEVRMLNARLLLEEGKPEAALTAFSTLRKEFVPEQADTSFRSRALPEELHLCVIGEARARHKMGKVTEATDNLLAFVQNHPRSPMLAEAFAYLLEWLPGYSAEAEDPVRARILERLEEWSPLLREQSYPLIAGNEESVIGINVKKDDTSEERFLHAHALRARIIALQQAGNAAAADAMRQLVFAMQVMHPEQQLTYEAWLLWAKNSLTRGDRAEAQKVLDFLVTTASGVPQLDATVLLGKECFAAENFEAASVWFGKAANELRAEQRRSALFNSALAALKHHHSMLFETIQKDAEPKLQVSLMLEKALSLAKSDAAAALPMLDEFLTNHPQHKRAHEARLALASCAINLLPPNFPLAKSQLESIDTNVIDAELLALAWIQYAHAEMNYVDLASRCRSFLTDFPESRENGKVRLNLGVSLYQTGDYGEARMVLQKLAADVPTLSGPATMFAARAAARSGTPQSIVEAGVLYDQVAAANTSLSRSALMEKAGAFIDSKSTDHLQSACNILSELIASVGETSSLLIPAHLMLIEGYFALGSVDAQNYSKALSLQRKTLDFPKLTEQERYRVFYFRGLCLEQLGKDSEAIDSYYQVIDSAANQRPLSWEHVDRSVFNALALLEKNERWESAIALARKIAALEGPRAKEAEERARRLTLEHFIFDQ